MKQRTAQVMSDVYMLGKPVINWVSMVVSACPRSSAQYKHCEHVPLQCSSTISEGRALLHPLQGY